MLSSRQLGLAEFKLGARTVGLSVCLMPNEAIWRGTVFNTAHSLPIRQEFLSLVTTLLTHRQSFH